MMAGVFDHKIVLSHDATAGATKVSCECTQHPPPQGRKGQWSHDWFGYSKTWRESVELFNSSAHNGYFGFNDLLRVPGVYPGELSQEISAATPEEPPQPR